MSEGGIVVPELEAYRNDLDLAIQMLTKALDNPPEGLVPNELDIIRQRRAQSMIDAAQLLYNKICGRRTR